MNRLTRMSLLTILALGSLPFLAPLLTGEVFGFRDHETYYLPLRYFTSEALRAGVVPLWNPFSGSGEAWLANPQTGIFYPPAWIFAVVSFPTAYVLYLMLHVWALGIGGFLLFNRWASEGSALVGATLLMLCGPVMSLLDVNNNLSTLAWLPLALWCAAGSADPTAEIPAGVSAVSLALMFLAGEPFMALLGWLAYAAVFLGKSLEFVFMKRLAWIFLLASLLISPQLFPFLESMQGSDRSTGFSAAVAFKDSMAPSDWLSAVLPPDVARIGNSSSQHYLPLLYLGAVPLFLALLSLLTAVDPAFRTLRRVTVGWVLLLLAAVGLSGGAFTPGLAPLWEAVHLNSNRFPARVAVLAALAVIGLVTMGLDCLKQCANTKPRAISVSVALAGLWLAARIGNLRKPGSSVMTGVALALFSAAALLWLFGTGSSLLKSQGPGAALVLSLLLAADLRMVASPLLESHPFRLPSSRVLHGFGSGRQKVIRIPRYLENGPLNGYTNLFYRIMDSDSAAPVRSMRYLDLMNVLERSSRFDLMEFLSIGYVLTNSRGVPSRLRLVDRDGSGLALYRNPFARPLMTLWGTFTPVGSEDEAFRRFLSPSSDARQNIYVTGVQTSSSRVEEPPAGTAAQGAVTNFSLNAMSIDVSAPARSLLSLSQLDADGWTVSVDGRRAPKLRANGLFRAVMIPAGRHRVDWSYRPLSLIVGLMLGMIGLCFLSVDLALHDRRLTRSVMRTQ